MFAHNARRTDTTTAKDTTRTNIFATMFSLSYVLRLASRSPALFILGDGCRRKRAKEPCRRRLCHVLVDSTGAVASENLHGTRIARRDYLTGTRIGSGVVMRAIHGVLHLNPSNEESMYGQESRSSRLMVWFGMIPCIAA